MPAPQAWNDRLETGIDVIDQQHQQLFGFIETLETRIHTGECQPIQQAVRQLIDFLISHNEYEQSLLRAAGHPRLDLHHQQYLSFRIRTHNYSRRLRDTPEMAEQARQMLDDLRHWVLQHIQQDIRHHARTLRRHLRPGRLAALRH